MTPGGPTPGKRQDGSTGWIVALVVLAGLFAAGAVLWKIIPSSRFSPAAPISLEEYFTLKAAKKVRAAWLDQAELYVEVDPDYIRDGHRFRYVVVGVPPAYLVHPDGFRELRAGIDPSRFTVLRK